MKTMVTPRRHVATMVTALATCSDNGNCPVTRSDKGNSRQEPHNLLVHKGADTDPEHDAAMTARLPVCLRCLTP